MCDTLIATPTATIDGKAIFAKNSDRPPNEGQQLAFIPAASHAAGSRVKCTHIEITQVKQTNAVLLSKPFWMWGAEIGVNQHGVAIGNEAIFSKVPAQKEPALLGMDLLRLGLERAATARAALQVMIDLLEEFGQGGNCTHDHETYYHNSFIISDPRDAWALEMVAKHWAARHVTDTYSISNCLTITNQWDMASKDLVEYAVQNRWARSAQDFDYAKDYSDFLYTTFARGRARCDTTTRRLRQAHHSLPSMIDILRDHGGKNFTPPSTLTDINICAHAGFGPIRSTQSTGSFVVLLDEDTPIVFATGTAAPCTGIFKPIWLDAPLPDFGPAPTDHYDSASLFWAHERLHRAVLEDADSRLPAYKSERDALEAEFIEGALSLRGESAKKRSEYSTHCFDRAEQAEIKWLEQVGEIPARWNGAWLYQMAWDRFNREAKIQSLL